MAKRPTGLLAAVTGKDVSIDSAEHYDNWSESYDHDLITEYGYCAPRIAADAFALEMVDRDAAVIDIGCGTGLVGTELARHGFETIDGVDISGGMLARAEATGIYRSLILQDAEGDSVIAKGNYDGVISVGTFGIGQLSKAGAPLLVAMVKPGGLVVIFMNAEPYLLDDYEPYLKAMEADGIWSIERIEDHNYMDALDRPGKLIIAHRCHWRAKARRQAPVPPLTSTTPSVPQRRRDGQTSGASGGA
ncbi:MAG: methyltransferase domain-containing protein [Alphaproteobacteria bacterium]|jgi:SAM-dependent methyltransferase|nr:class I SAM-dependent methyltransferase [Rhodospirillaceae bacterium]MBT7613790.1 class I SAM-dependent methyltransferase [Rhodospirillaceae bacterium]MBT7646754.1 class I SAM-dependent methyltransferase [Rhodospirillaceae bacterium]MDG2481100.1 methyltransferase domain-containing protein [Alphaproteobacteria bacterium]